MEVEVPRVLSWEGGRGDMQGGEKEKESGGVGHQLKSNNPILTRWGMTEPVKVYAREVSLYPLLHRRRRLTPPSLGSACTRCSTVAAA